MPPRDDDTSPQSRARRDDPDSAPPPPPQDGSARFQLQTSDVLGPQIADELTQQMPADAGELTPHVKRAAAAAVELARVFGARHGAGPAFFRVTITAAKQVQVETHRPAMRGKGSISSATVLLDETPKPAPRSLLTAAVASAKQLIRGGKPAAPAGAAPSTGPAPTPTKPVIQTPPVPSPARSAPPKPTK